MKGLLPSWTIAMCVVKFDFWEHAPDLNKMLMDYSNNTKVMQWHKNLWKSDKTNNKFMEKLGKRTKHTFGNWQINWLSNHVSKILTQFVVDKYIRFLGFFISVFFSIQNTDLKVVFCIHIIKPLVCLCVWCFALSTFLGRFQIYLYLRTPHGTGKV